MKKLKWTTVQRKVNDLIPDEENPRTISESGKQKLIKSIEKFNLVDIPVIDFNEEIISGDKRVKILKLVGRGEEIIDVRYPNRKLTKAERKEYNLQANVHAGEFDLDLLQKYVEDIDIELDDFGFDIKDAVSISEEKPTAEVVADIESSEHEQKTIKLKPFKQVHVLLSFSPDHLIEIQHLLEELKASPCVDYEQISN